MIKGLELLGTRLLGMFVPKVDASADTCACTPGSGWCQYYGTRTACVCNSDCITTSCWCDPGGLCPPW